MPRIPSPNPRKIYSVLVENPRQRVCELVRSTGIPRSTIVYWLDRMYFRGYLVCENDSKEWFPENSEMTITL